MGSFASSVQVYVGDKPAAEIHTRLHSLMREKLASLGYVPAESPDSVVDRTVTIAQASDDLWITVYDDSAGADSVAEDLSRSLGLMTVSAQLNDSDALLLNLFKQGVKVDQYDSAPELFAEKLSAKQRKAVAGKPELWEELFLPGMTAEEFRKVLTKNPLFAEEILTDVAHFVGMNVDLLLAYPQEVDDAKTISRLAFRLKETPAYRVKAEGPPRFELNSYGPELTVSEGDTVDIDLSVYNRGGGAEGLSVIIFGEALDQGLIEVQSVRLVAREDPQGYKTIDAAFVPARIQLEGKEVDAYAAQLPDFTLPWGVAGGVNQNWGAQWRQAFEENQKTSISAHIKCKALKPGQSNVVAGLMPMANPTGRAELKVNLEISPHSWRPLHYSNKAPSAYLRFMDQPTRLVGFIALNAD